MKQLAFVMATKNQHKLAEFRRILSPLGFSVTTANLEDVAEIGATFAENAFLKAQAACKQTGFPAIADDSGLMVDALGGAPGIFSARYAGEQATDADRIQKLLQELREVPPAERAACFVSAICCVFPGGECLQAQGVCEGTIAFAPAGEGGFGYDPVFLVGEKTYAEMTPAEKDRVSHRGRAFRLFAQKLEAWKQKEEKRNVDE